MRSRSIRPTRLVAAFQRLLSSDLGSPSCRPAPSRSSTTATASARSAGVPAITHGPRAGGQHTVSEWVEIDDLVRVAWLYAATAAGLLQPARMHQ